MRGTVGTPGTPAFGIVMDCLVLTLREKMDQQWNHVAGSTPRNFLGRFLARHKPPDPEVYADQLVALYDIARAMRYLHNHMLLFRDLKPENVAYDIRGDMRLFDFGLAKELAVKDLVEGDDYHCTGLTGSRRYMAPEVIACKDYGLKADVYSYAIVVWEVVAGQSAYKHHAQTLEDHFEHVVVKGKRPSKRALKGSQLSNTLVQLVQDMWDGDSARRPTFRTICDQLTVDYNRLNDSGCGGAMDRSQQLLNRSLRSICDSGDSLDG
jgi:serine/threonine protein kinase